MSQPQVSYTWLNTYYGKGKVKIKLIDGVPVSEVINDKHYLLIGNEKKFYQDQIKDKNNKGDEYEL